MWLISRLVTHSISCMIILHVLHRWCMDQTSKECHFWAVQNNRGDSKNLPAFFLLVCFFGLGLWGFLPGLDFTASLIMIFMKSSGSDSPATRLLDSPCDSFLNSEYLTYKLPLHDGPFPSVSSGLSTKRTVHWDTKGSLMMTISIWLWHSQHVQKRPTSPCAVIWGWTIASLFSNSVFCWWHKYHCVRRIFLNPMLLRFLFCLLEQ